MAGLNPITPVRILDTRGPNGGHPAALAAGETFTLPVLGRGAVPLSGVAGIIGNVTVIPSTAGGYLTLWPAGYARPTASNINFPASGQPVANTFTVALGPTGAISIYDGFAAGAHVVIDVQGWISADPLDAVGPSSVIPTPAVPTAIDSVKAAQVLTTALRYGMDTWWPGPAQTLLATPLTQTLAHDEVRRLSMAALGMSTALATGLSGDSVMRARLIALVTKVAGAHVTNASGGWGEGWQTSMWSSICGRAAWFMWQEMPTATRDAVARIVAHEADYAARYQIKYLRDAAGTVLSPGDSGTEEVAWQGSAMHIAAVMLPTHPHVVIWETELRRFALASTARPADVATTPQITGSNIEANGDVVNHNRWASDYATSTIYQNLDAVALYALAGRPAPQALRQFLAPIYAAFTGITYAGGTTYVPGTAGIYYPQGCDWGTGQKLPYALADALALTWGFDPGTAATYLGLHLDAALAMQSRHADGHTYANATEYNYEGCEEHVMLLAALTWWALYLRDQGLGTFA